MRRCTIYPVKSSQADASGTIENCTWMINIFGSGAIEVVVGSDVRAWKLQFGLMKAKFCKVSWESEFLFLEMVPVPEMRR